MEWIEIKTDKDLPAPGWTGIVKWTDDAGYAYIDDDGLFNSANVYDYGKPFGSQPSHYLDETPSHTECEKEIERLTNENARLSQRYFSAEEINSIQSAAYDAGYNAAGSDNHLNNSL